MANLLTRLRGNAPEQRHGLTDYLSWAYETFQVGGNTYTLPFTTTMPGQKAEPISDTLTGYAMGGYRGNGVVFGLERIRLKVFSQGRFQWQQLRGGRPGMLFGDESLRVLETPWPGGTTGDLLAALLLDADLAGNAYFTIAGGQFSRLRPDWVEVVLGERAGGVGGLTKAGYVYWHGGKSQDDPHLFTADQVAHFMPQPDPLFSFRGMSWLTPVVREIEADSAATTHKLKFFENAATPNLAVQLQETDPAKFGEWVEAMDASHKGVQNAYKTLYTGGGADVTVIGSDMRQLDFKVTQGAGETRLALAAGVPPTVASLSEGLQGSSLNAGNFGQARRQFADIEMAQLWENVAGSLEVLIRPPRGVRLTVDRRDIPFLREDAKDAADILNRKMLTIESGVRAGYKPESIVAAVVADDLTLLEHTGLFSVQLQPPGMETPDDSVPAVDAG